MFILLCVLVVDLLTRSTFYVMTLSLTSTVGAMWLSRLSLKGTESLYWKSFASRTLLYTACSYVFERENNDDEALICQICQNFTHQTFAPYRMYNHTIRMQGFWDL